MRPLISIWFSAVMLCSAFWMEPAVAQRRAGSSSARPPIQTNAAPNQDINTTAFVDSIVTTVNDDLMGYVVLLQGQDGKIIAEINYGYARRPGEAAGVQPFTRNTTVTWGSVTKLVTAAVVTDRIEQSPRQSLDDKMADYLPARWQVGAAWRQTSIRHLLSYQGGFDDDVFNDANPKKPFWERVATRQSERAVGSRKYVNANYSAFHYLGKLFTGPGEWKAIEDGYRSNEITYEDYLWSHTRTIWKNQLRTRIYEPLGIRGECGRIDFNGNNYALYYQNPTSSKGFLVNPADMENCASGGIVMSPKDMGVFLHALTQTEKIVSRETYAATFGLPSNQNVVGWDRSVAVTGGRAFLKSGAHTVSGSSQPGNTASGRVETYVIAFPNGMTVVFATNSSFPGDAGWDRSSLLRSAYEAGLAARRRD